MTERAVLALEDGTLWEGAALGARGTTTGEVVFNTSMMGYQEVLTDPSYYGQIVVMTTSHVGNTGTNGEDAESAKAWLAGFAVREATGAVGTTYGASGPDREDRVSVAGEAGGEGRASGASGLEGGSRTSGAGKASGGGRASGASAADGAGRANGANGPGRRSRTSGAGEAGGEGRTSGANGPHGRGQTSGAGEPGGGDRTSGVSNWRSTATLDDFLRDQGVVSIQGLDTRALVRHIRSQGALRGALANVDPDPERLVALARETPSMNGADLVQKVTCESARAWTDGIDAQWYAFNPVVESSKAYHVVAYDYGIKYSILRMLVARGCTVTVVPAATQAADVLAMKPDGVLLSNGPGDPAAVTYAVENVRGLVGRVPVFGICLGHQILALALGGTTYKLLFGHRGSNQPVKNCQTGKVEITTHNHGFAVRADSLPQGVEITHVNLNDQCVEGLAAPERHAFSVQFHPEAAAGPHDAMALFDDFVAAMGER